MLGHFCDTHTYLCPSPGHHGEDGPPSSHIPHSLVSGHDSDPADPYVSAGGQGVRRWAQASQGKCRQGCDDHRYALIVLFPSLQTENCAQEWSGSPPVASLGGGQNCRSQDAECLPPRDTRKGMHHAALSESG